MIVVELIGGLGNQMFQYAAARALADRLGTSLKIDVIGFDAYKLHEYSLHHFRIGAATATRLDVAPVRSRPSVRRAAHLLPGDRVRHVFTEGSLRFDPSLFACQDGTYLRGYWQSEKYFADKADLVRAEFALRSPLSSKSRGVLEEIEADPAAVSLHVRRGDYAFDPHTKATHGLVGEQYYRRAISAFRSRFSGATFYAFSDDPEWVADTFARDGDVRVVNANDASRNYEDLALMSACRHHIIANSSFSWWGAWLNEAPKKCVIAPRSWFQDPTRVDSDLVPTDWCRM
jgi:hypothetical protein